LILESSLNRLRFQAELQNLRSAYGRSTEALRAPRKLLGVLAVAAPAAGLLLGSGARRGSLIKCAARAVKWVPAIYQIWRQFKPAKPKAEKATIESDEER
jgi:hypothetical protein